MTVPRIPRAAVALALWFAASAIPAQEESGAASHDGKSSTRPAVEKMLSERGTPADFEKAVAAARKQGAKDQAVLEARFLYLVDRHDDGKLVELLPEFEARKDKFDLADSEIFAVREDWLAVIEYLESLAALQKGDKDGFKKHITEAFWLSPRQGSAFATHIDRLRLDEAMKDLKIRMGAELEPFKGDKLTLSALVKDKKAVLLHFWSPWSHECQESMPDFKAVAAEFAKGDIAVASLLVESSPEVMKDAKAMLAAQGPNPPGAWLKGDAVAKLARTLRIQNVPAMALISTEGAVLYNGDPSDDGLWAALKTISPGIKRPELDEK